MEEKNDKCDDLILIPNNQSANKSASDSTQSPSAF